MRVARRPPRPTTPAPGSAAPACGGFGAEVFSASWDSVVFDVPGQSTSLQRVPILEPLKGTEAGRRASSCAAAPDAASLLRCAGRQRRPGELAPSTGSTAAGTLRRASAGARTEARTRPP